MGTRLGTTMTCGRLGHLSRAALTFLAAAVLHTALPAPARANDLERKLFKEAAPKVLAHLQQEGYHNVGVLKFQVKKGNAPASDNVGPINLGIANRLELALVLANKQDD